MDNSTLNLCLSVNMGALHTGVFLVGHASDDPISADNAEVFTLEMPKGGQEGMRYSSKTRTMARHIRRGIKRFALVRRLLLEIVRAQMKAKGLQLNPRNARRATEALCGILRRRGYSRLESETDLSALDEVSPEVLSAHPALSTYLSPLLPLREQWENLTCDIARVQAFLDDAQIPADRKTMKKFITAGLPELDKAQASACLEAVLALRKDASSMIASRLQGNRHRKEYLALIREDIEKSPRLKAVRVLFGGSDRLFHLIANLSNLQLRVLRRYFNDVSRKGGHDVWQPARLQKEMVRVFQTFHLEKEALKERDALVKELRNSADFLETLCTIDPVRTIPPYEDMNNRRLPVDQTLLLNPRALSNLYGNAWRVWAQRLLAHDPTLNERLDTILAHTDRASQVATLKGADPVDPLDIRLSYVLQRALDRSKANDPFSLRFLGTTKLNTSSVAGKQEFLSATLGSQHLKPFLNFARNYYIECERAKKGIWLADDEGALLERSNLHPPAKKNVLETLVGGTLCLDAKAGLQFMQNVWLLPVTGRSTVRSVCKSFADEIKRYANFFNAVYWDARSKGETQGVSKLNAEEKTLFALAAKVKAVADTIAEAMNLDKVARDRIANPYSLAQLYNLIETDRAGFTSTSRAVFLENTWRRSIHAETGAPQCVPLTADSARPFDGMLDKLISRQVWELARKVANRVKTQAQFSNGAVNIGIAVGRNAFAFESDLADLKMNELSGPQVAKAKARKEAAKKMQKKSSESTDQQDQRILGDSFGVCPLTGATLNADAVVFGHIIEPAKTLEISGTVYESEPNLLAVAPHAAQKRAGRRLEIGMLAKPFLTAVFGTTDTSAVEKIVHDCVSKLIAQKRLTIFRVLTPVERVCVRLALMFNPADDLYRDVVRVLNTLNIVKVNGTHKWFMRTLILKTRELLADWCTATGNNVTFDVAAVPESRVHRLRQALVEVWPQAAKKSDEGEGESIRSQCIDALCVFGAACGMPKFVNFIDADFEFCRSDCAALLRDLYPERTEVLAVAARNALEKKRVSGNPIFKSGMFAEHFLPIITHGEEVFLGFGLPKNGDVSESSVKVLGESPWELVEQIAPYLDKVPVKNTNTRTYNIVNEKAVELFSRVQNAQGQADPKDLADATLLKSLWYFTQRKDVSSAFTKANKLLNREECLEKIRSITDVKVKGSAKSMSVTSESSAWAFAGVVRLPVASQWLRIAERVYGDADKEGFDLPQSLQKARVVASGKMPQTDGRSRHPNSWSLPALTTSSALVRIRRQTFDRRIVTQVQAVDGAAYAGFTRLEDGAPDWNSPICREHLSSKNVMPVTPTTSKSGSQNIVSMLEWRTVFTSADGTRVAMCPATTTRGRLRVTLPVTVFEKLVGIESAQDCPLKLKPTAWKTSVTTCRELLDAPRGRIAIESVDRKLVIFNYTTASTCSKALRDAYSATKS